MPTNGFKWKIHTSIAHFLQHLMDGFLEVLWADALSGTHFLRLLKFVFVDVNPNDPCCSSCFTAHDNRQADSSKAKHCTGGAWGDLCFRKCKNGWSNDCWKVPKLYKVLCLICYQDYSDTTSNLLSKPVLASVASCLHWGVWTGSVVLKLCQTLDSPGEL